MNTYFRTFSSCPVFAFLMYRPQTIQAFLNGFFYKAEVDTRHWEVYSNSWGRKGETCLGLTRIKYIALFSRVISWVTIVIMLDIPFGASESPLCNTHIAPAIWPIQFGSMRTWFRMLDTSEVDGLYWACPQLQISAAGHSPSFGPATMEKTRRWTSRIQVRLRCAEAVRSVSNNES